MTSSILLCRRGMFSVVLAALLMVTVTGHAQDLMDPKALDLFQRMSATVGKANSLHFKAYALFDDFETVGVKFKRGVIQEVTVQRPNRLHFRTTSDTGAVREGWYDGTTFTIAQPADRVYAQIPGPATLDELLDLLHDKYSVNMPTVDILYSDLHGRLSDHLLSGVYVAQNTIEGASLDHISFETTPADIQLWIHSGGQPVPQRMVVNYVALEGEPEYLVMFQDWALDEFVNASEFRFEPPEGWTKSEMLGRQ